MHDVDGNPTIPHREWLVMFNEVLEEFKDELKSQGRQDEFIGAKVRWISSFLGRLRDDCPPRSSTLLFALSPRMTWTGTRKIALR